MQEIIDQILGYLKGIWNKRWYAMLIAWLLCLLGWSYVYVLPDTFESKAKIYIDTQSLLKPLLRGLTVQTNVDQQINLMVRTLLTRPNIEKIIRLSDLDLNVDNELQFDELVRNLQKEIKISKTRRSKNVYDLFYQSASPEVAQVVLQSVITVFIENSIGESKDESISARKFLNNQINEYEKRLIEAENRLKDFKQKNVGLLPSSSGDYYARMEQAKNTLEESKLGLKEAQRRHSAIRKELANIANTLTSSNTGTHFVTSFDQRIASLNKNLDDMLLKYTDSHPDVVSIRRVLADLKEKQQQELNEIKNSSKGAASGLELNPVYQELKISLGGAKAEVESLTVRVKEYSQRYEKLQRLVNTIPEIEAQLSSLNRDYNITKEKYEEFLDRRESAAISESVDQTTESVQFKVIEAPRVENKPVGPNRILFSTTVLILSIGAGIGFSFLLSQINPVIMTGRQVAQLTGLPILGSVSAVVSPGQRRRRGLMVLSYLTLFSLLLMSYGILVGWYVFFSDI